MSIALAVAIVVVMLAARVAWVAWRQASLRALVERDIAELFPESFRPGVAVSGAYGYPRFEIAFATTDLLHEANRSGKSEALLDRIQQHCRDEGPKRRPFDARTAVSFVTTERD